MPKLRVRNPARVVAAKLQDLMSLGLSRSDAGRRLQHGSYYMDMAGLKRPRVAVQPTKAQQVKAVEDKVKQLLADSDKRVRNTPFKPPAVEDDLFKRSAADEAGLMKAAAQEYVLAVQHVGQGPADAYVAAFLDKLAADLPEEHRSSAAKLIDRLKRMLATIRAEMSAGKEAGQLDKSAAPWGTTSDMIDWARRKTLGEGGKAQAAGFGADIGSYFVPYVGPARTGVDMMSDFANVWGRGHSLKQRAGYGLSGLGNALWTAAGLFPMFGGSIAGGLGAKAQGGIKGWLQASGLGKAVKGHKAFKAVEHGAGSRLGGLGHYLLGAKANPYAAGKASKSTAMFVPEFQNILGKGVKYKPGVWNKMKYMGWGLPRNITPMALALGRPTEPGQMPHVLPPPPFMFAQQGADPRYYGGNRQMRSAIRS